MPKFYWRRASLTLWEVAEVAGAFVKFSGIAADLLLWKTSGRPLVQEFVPAC